MTRKYLFNRGAVALALAAIAAGPLSGCDQTTRGITTVAQSYGIGSDLTPEEQALVDESADIVERSMFQGALIGALAGCLGGMFVADNLAVGCAAGAAGGAVIGGVAGATVGQGNADASITLKDENEKIAALQEERQRLDSFSVKLKNRIAAQEAELQELDRKYVAQQITAEAYAQDYNRIKSFRTQVKDNLEAELEDREEDRAKLVEASTKGVDVSRVRQPMDENIRLLRTLSDAAGDLAPPTAPIQGV
ncbi:hypothetical protein [uncultured Albimonas sp.]|uniref:hypothetical protein n=1 Tax=uncultured Albimonas sp. TaxID=1331701 RepID=UPI0030EBCE79|tara:strand:+ start:11733 stop:12482 length:750 start_codon:yes stop_codon:yes gene_type:complete